MPIRRSLSGRFGTPLMVIDALSVKNSMPFTKMLPKSESIPKAEYAGPPVPVAPPPPRTMPAPPAKTIKATRARRKDLTIECLMMVTLLSSRKTARGGTTHCMQGPCQLQRREKLLSFSDLQVVRKHGWVMSPGSLNAPLLVAGQE